MMTDEQAAFIAASIALQGSPLTSGLTPAAGTVDLGDSITALAGQIYGQLREWNEGREHDELQDRLGVVNENIQRRR